MGFLRAKKGSGFLGALASGGPVSMVTIIYVTVFSRMLSRLGKWDRALLMTV